MAQRFKILLALSLLFIIIDTNLIGRKYKLIVFEGSDWCANCKRFETKILSDKDFIFQMQERNIVIEKIDFPQRKKLPKEKIDYNAAIAKKFKFDGTYPTLLIARTDTLLFEKIEYSNQSPTEFLKEIYSKLALLE